MRKFILEIFIFSFFILITIYGLFSLADGYSDPFYIRFTTPKQTSLILGTSRSAQGIQPMILNEILGRSDFFNYSFTVKDSPYGEVYFNSIIKKLSNSTNNNVHILAIDPWCISSEFEKEKELESYRESRSFIAKTKFVNMKPNVLYMLNSYNAPYINILLRSKNKNMFLHEDGWLEVNIDMEETKVAKRTAKKMNEYTKMISSYKYSLNRYLYFKKTIDYLSKSGKVYIVRLPIHPLMMNIEKRMMPNFNQLIAQMCINNDVPYLDLTKKNNDYKYTDGNHLHKASAALVTREIANWILKNNIER